MMTYKVLVIDDDAAIKLLIFEILEATNGNVYKIIAAATGEQGIAIAKIEKPDIILTDWDLPGINGIEVIKQLKKIPDLKDIPVIVVSGIMANMNDLKIALEAGAVDYIRKPFNDTELISRLNSAITIRKYYMERLKIEEENSKLIKSQYEEKIAQLINETYQIEKHNESVISIQQSLNQIVNRFDFVKPAFDELSQFINNQINSQEDAERIKQLLNSLDGEFLKRLSEKFPNLTVYEQRLCAFIHLGFDTNKIAQVLHISYDSAKTTRKRLRKKLNLESKVDLYKFICSI